MIHKCVICGSTFEGRKNVLTCSMKCKILDGIEIIDDCWFYKKSTSGDYSKINYKQKWWAAHRMSYTVFNGVIPKGLLVCHKCDNPKCVNPQHLFLGTTKDNVSDRVRKGRTTHGVINSR